MISLYKIFETVILEDKKVLTESISKADVIKAIDSNLRYRVWYQGEHETTANMRLVDFYGVGMSRTNNEVARVYQPFGFTTSENGKWKLLRLDRITRMEPTGFKLGKKPIDQYDASIPKFNVNGDASMSNSTPYIKQFKN